MKRNILVLALALAAFAPEARADEPTPTVSWYGFVRMDAIYDDSRMSHPHFPFWVQSEPDGAKNRQELALHPRLTRLGAKLNPMPWSDVRLDGKIEIDFQNGGKESRAVIRMRHAFLRLQQGDVELLAGQTWDLISPLYPAANNDGMMWHAGNVGDRRPQLRVSYQPKLSLGTLRVAAAAGMTGAIDNQDYDGNGRLDGLDAGLPTVQALVELEHERVLVGVWGHAARETLEAPVGANAVEDFDSYAAGGHLKLKLSDALWIQGEGFYGSNLTDIRGGIGQAVNAAGKEIRSLGGWGEIGYKLNGQYTVAAGATLDKPTKSDLDTGMRELNYAAFLVQHYKLHPKLKLGLEYLLWTTEYLDTDRGRAHRVNAHATMSF